jgi:DNA repair protein RadA/Sms
VAVYKCAGRNRHYFDGIPYCDYESELPWHMDPCPGCGSRSLSCDKIGPDRKKKSSILTFADIANMKPKPRISTRIDAFDKVLNGGLPQGGVVVISGPPGVGKTTILMEIANKTAHGGRRAMYASGEQGKDGVIEIAHRLKLTENRDVALQVAEGDIYKITSDVEDHGSAVLVIDSLQTASLDDANGDEGSAEQTRAVANYLTAWALRTKVAVILVSHVNKEGDLAGPRAIEHLVDGTLELDLCPELDEDGEIVPETKGYRSLMSGAKFRLGESGVTEMFEMTGEGLKPLADRPKRKSRLVDASDAPIKPSRFAQRDSDPPTSPPRLYPVK